MWGWGGKRALNLPCCLLGMGPLPALHVPQERERERLSAGSWGLEQQHQRPPPTPAHPPPPATASSELSAWNTRTRLRSRWLRTAAAMRDETTQSATK